MKEVDADNVTTLYRYNADGDLTVTAIDMDRDGVIDFGGPDRVTENVITTGSGTELGVFKQTVTRVYPEDGSATPKVVATRQESTDGLRVKTDNFGRVTTVDRDLPADGAWTVTTTYPDTTSRVEEYADTKLFRTTVYDSSNPPQQVVRTTVVYNDLGLVRSSTDARTGASDFEYYEDGSLKKVISPHTSVGTNRDTTVYTRDGMGRETAVTLPDGSRGARGLLPDRGGEEEVGIADLPAALRI